ncbi:MAG: hypothetical protein PHO83_14560 [Geobacteraceae bacterium]|nr:hypothetical protein [Geobacteraceae bacterium]
MSDKILDIEASRRDFPELIDRVVDLQLELQAYESRLETMESLLDRILICLNAFDNGESRHSLGTIAQAIVQDIYLYRLQENGSLSAEA